MSHDATNWAIKQRGIRPALKVVLWNLCDRYHPDNGCFPSQDTLAADCEVPRSTLNVYLKELEDAGLIAREQRRERGSNRQERTRYRFPFEPDFPEKTTPNPSPESGHGAESRNDVEPSPENGESRVQNLDSNPVREPVKETGKEREGERDAREGVQEPCGDAVVETPASVERAFRRWFPTWPSYVSDSEDAARKVWFDLCAADRASAIDRMGDYLEAVKGSGRKIICSAAVYLRERRWEKLPARAAVEQTAGPEGPFGKAWGAKRLCELMQPHRPLPALPGFIERMILDGKLDRASEERSRLAKFGWPVVTDMHERAASCRGVLVSQSIKALGAGFVPVKVGSEMWEAWRRLHERRSWPWLPDTGRQQFVYFPPPPDGVGGSVDDAVAMGMAEFEALARGMRGDEHAA